MSIHSATNESLLDSLCDMAKGGSGEGMLSWRTVRGEILRRMDGWEEKVGGYNEKAVKAMYDETVGRGFLDEPAPPQPDQPETVLPDVRLMDRELLKEVSDIE